MKSEVEVAACIEAAQHLCRRLLHLRTRDGLNHEEIMEAVLRIQDDVRPVSRYMTESVRNLLLGRAMFTSLLQISYVTDVPLDISEALARLEASIASGLLLLNGVERTLDLPKAIPENDADGSEHRKS